MKTRADRWWKINLLVCAWAVLLPSVSIAAAEGEEFPPETAGADAATEEGQAEPAEKPDPFVVPDGSAEELLEYIKGLGDHLPASQYDQASRELTKRAYGAALEAADKILSGEPSDEHASEAVRWQLGALVRLDQLDDPQAQKRIEGLPAELEKAGLKEHVRQAKFVLLQSRLQRSRGAGPEKLSPLIEQVAAYLAEGPLEQNDVSLAMMTADEAQMRGHDDLAAGAYRDFAKILSAREDETLAGIITMMEGSARRLSLPGKKMLVEGVTVDGKPFQWSEYDGKVVLVDFWATWCGPCVAELPNLMRNYELYHDRGFEVVAISLDEDRRQLLAFLEGRELPWTVLFDADPDSGSLADHYGIVSIPTVILVGPDGKVVSLNARGPALGEQLEELLGPLEEKKKSEADEEAG